MIILILLSFSYWQSSKNYFAPEDYKVMGGPNELNLNSQDSLNFGILKSSPINELNQNKNSDNLNLDKLLVFGILENKSSIYADQNKLLSLTEQNKTTGEINSEGSENQINFILPVQGLNWQKLHPKNAVDIAASCGKDIVAAADGLVIDVLNSGWNSGYGKYIKIEHLPNIKTAYAHLSSLNVKLGDYVKQGQKIGEVGQSGEATGCHLHFEVLGAKNPFAK
ncbi:MAG: M23 family metallopeptidase [Minisyncoccia bacterium]